jgi:hypothetical protein
VAGAGDQSPDAGGRRGRRLHFLRQAARRHEVRQHSLLLGGLREDALRVGGKAVAKSSTAGTAQAKPPAKGQRLEAVNRLVKFIDSCGGPDKFIDTEEEHAIFRKGGALELSLTEIEAALNRRCSDGGWVRQSRLSEKLFAMLHEAAKDDGMIDHQAYDHIVNFAVKRRMPRRDADEHCVTLVLDNAWRVKESFFDKWFSKKRRKYGL